MATFFHDVVLDVGTAWTRAGLAGDGCPRVVLRTPPAAELPAFLRALLTERLHVLPRWTRVVLCEASLAPRAHTAAVAHALAAHCRVHAVACANSDLGAAYAALAAPGQPPLARSLSASGHAPVAAETDAAADAAARGPTAFLCVDFGWARASCVPVVVGPRASGLRATALVACASTRPAGVLAAAQNVWDGAVGVSVRAASGTSRSSGNGSGLAGGVGGNGDAASRAREVFGPEHDRAFAEDLVRLCMASTGDIDDPLLLSAVQVASACRDGAVCTCTVPADVRVRAVALVVGGSALAEEASPSDSSESSNESSDSSDNSEDEFERDDFDEEREVNSDSDSEGSESSEEEGGEKSSPVACPHARVVVPAAGSVAAVLGRSPGGLADGSAAGSAPTRFLTLGRTLRDAAGGAERKVLRGGGGISGTHSNASSTPGDVSEDSESESESEKSEDSDSEESDLEDDDNAMSIAGAVRECLRACPVDLRRELAAHIVPVGGGWLVAGADRALVDALDRFAARDRAFAGIARHSAVLHLPFRPNNTAWVGVSALAAASQLARVGDGWVPADRVVATHGYAFSDWTTLH